MNMVARLQAFSSSIAQYVGSYTAKSVSDFSAKKVAQIVAPFFFLVAIGYGCYRYFISKNEPKEPIPIIRKPDPGAKASEENRAKNVSDSAQEDFDIGRICRTFQERGKEEGEKENLEEKILLKVFEFLPAKDLIAVGQTCKKYQRLSLDHNLWESLFRRDFQTHTKIEGGNYRDRYKTESQLSRLLLTSVPFEAKSIMHNYYDYFSMFSVTEILPMNASERDCFVAFTTLNSFVVQIAKKNGAKYELLQSLGDPKEWKGVKFLKFCNGTLFVITKKEAVKICGLTSLQGKFIEAQSIPARGSKILCFEAKDDDQFALSYDDHTIKIWKSMNPNAYDYQEIQTLKLEDDLSCIKMKMGGDFLFAELQGKNGNQIKIWRQEAARAYQEFSTLRHIFKTPLSYLEFTQESLITVEKENNLFFIKIWEFEQEQSSFVQTQEIPLEQCASFTTSEGNLLVMDSKSIKVWWKKDNNGYYELLGIFTSKSRYNNPNLQLITTNESFFFINNNQLLYADLPSNLSSKSKKESKKRVSLPNFEESSKV